MRAQNHTRTYWRCARAIQIRNVIIISLNHLNARTPKRPANIDSVLNTVHRHRLWPTRNISVIDIGWCARLGNVRTAHRQRQTKSSKMHFYLNKHEFHAVQMDVCISHSHCRWIRGILCARPAFPPLDPLLERNIRQLSFCIILSENGCAQSNMISTFQYDNCDVIKRRIQIANLKRFSRSNVTMLSAKTKTNAIESAPKQRGEEKNVQPGNMCGVNFNGGVIFFSFSPFHSHLFIVFYFVCFASAAIAGWKMSKRGKSLSSSCVAISKYNSLSAI